MAGWAASAATVWIAASWTIVGSWSPGFTAAGLVRDVRHARVRYIALPRGIRTARNGFLRVRSAQS
jgi:hypothetical protein